MKRLFLLAALLAAFAATAQTVEKQTFTYAVKDADTLRLDRYTVRTPEAALRPCMIFVFGGGFITGQRDAEQYASFFEYYAQRGYDVVSIDYRLGLKKATANGPIADEDFATAFVGTLAMATEDLYDATAYVLANARVWGINPDMVVACGSSAGAITALMGEYGICNGSALAQKLPAEFNYAGVISFAGAIFGMGEQLQWSRTPAPMMLFHGDADRNVPYDVVAYGPAGFFGSKAIAAQLTELRIPHWFYSVANTNHVMATRPMTENRDEIDAFLTRMVVAGQPLMIDTYVTPLDAPEIPKAFSMIDYIQANFGN